MRLKYKIQHYLTITDRELNFIIILAALLLIGTVAKHFQARSLPDYRKEYEEVDSLFAAISDQANPDSGAVDSTVGIPAELPSSTDAYESVVTTVNINSANLEELTVLPGIGPAMAQRIIDYRDRFGPFKNKTELTAIRGIGAKTFERIKDRVSV
ncbi:MAG: helix-hairpin-helix domain-containing protein [Rhodothermales bacterium]|nr:helix-hairpin-helix domain-containing protein [Rhodothermales bacterium]